MTTEKTQTGYLAKIICSMDLPLQALQAYDSAPFYIGTFHAEYGPITRESKEYYLTRDEAQDALAAGTWTQRLNHD